MTKWMLYVCFAAAMAQAGTLTLREAISRLERLNPDLAVARLRILESEANVGIVKSAYQPQANLTVQTAYQTGNLQGMGLVFPGFPSRIGPYRSFNARPQVTQTVLDLSLLSRIRAARAAKAGQEFDAEAVRDDLAIAVVAIYLQALQADSRVAASGARIRTAEAILAQSKDRESAGTGSKLDVARALEQLENEQVVRTGAARDAAVLRSMLFRALGTEGEAGVVLEKPTFAAAAAATRPELLAVEERAKEARQQSVAARRQRYPTVSAFADWGVLGAGPDRAIGTYTLGASVTVPLWTGRRIENEIAAAAVRESRVKEEQRKVRLQVAQEQEQADLEWAAARNAFAAANRAAAASKEILELATLRFQAGLATSVDVQVAQSGLVISEDQHIRAEYDVLLAEARIAKAGGNILSAIR